MEQKDKKPELILIRGVPGTGKSYRAKNMCKEMLAKGYVVEHWEADMFFVDKQTGKYNFIQEHLQEAHSWCLKKTRAALEQGHSCIVSNTFLKIQYLQPYLALAKELNLEKPRVILCFSKMGPSIHNIPAHVLKGMERSLQHYPNEVVY